MVLDPGYTDGVTSSNPSWATWNYRAIHTPFLRRIRVRVRFISPPEVVKEKAISLLLHFPCLLAERKDSKIQRDGRATRKVSLYLWMTMWTGIPVLTGKNFKVNKSISAEAAIITLTTFEAIQISNDAMVIAMQPGLRCASSAWSIKSHTSVKGTMFQDTHQLD